MKRILITGAAVFLLAAAARADKIKGDLHVSKKGETIKIDLSVLKDLLGVKSPRDVKVQYTVAGKLKDEKAALVEVKQCILGDEDWTVELKEIRAADDRMEILEGENRIEITAGKITVELTIRAAESRSCKVKSLASGKDELVQVEWCDAGDGKWSIDPAKGYTVETADGVSINGIAASKLKRLVSAKNSAFTLVNAKDLAAKDPWVETAEKHYKAMCENDWDGFKATFNKANRESGDKRGSTPLLYWETGRRMVEKYELASYRFDRMDDRNTEDKRKRIYFKRIKKNGEVHGGDCPIIIVLEDGKWVVDTATQ